MTFRITHILFSVLILITGTLLTACGSTDVGGPSIPQEGDTPSQEGDTLPQEGDTLPQEGNLPAPEEPEATALEEDRPADWCVETKPHPIGEQIAETHQVAYEEVMTWFCNGDTFDDIAIALVTSEESGISVEELLERRPNAESWEEVWADLDVFQE